MEADNCLFRCDCSFGKHKREQPAPSKTLTVCCSLCFQHLQKKNQKTSDLFWMRNKRWPICFLLKASSQFLCQRQSQIRYLGLLLPGDETTQTDLCWQFSCFNWVKCFFSERMLLAADSALGHVTAQERAHGKHFSSWKILTFQSLTQLKKVAVIPERSTGQLFILWSNLFTLASSTDLIQFNFFPFLHDWDIFQD